MQLLSFTKSFLLNTNLVKFSDVSISFAVGEKLKSVNGKKNMVSVSLFYNSALFNMICTDGVILIPAITGDNTINVTLSKAATTARTIQLRIGYY